VKPFFCLVFSFLAIPAIAVAGPVTGRVVDPTDRPVPSAVVILVTRGAAAQKVLTDARGEFTLQAPDSGDYEVRVAVPGFHAEPLRADGASAAQDIGVLRLEVSAVSEALVVSAAQVEIPLSSAASSVSVITEAEMQTKQVHSVADALRSVPGLTVTSAGTLGAVTGIFPRGGESNFTLVVVDDMPVNAFGGEFDFAHLSTANVERVEVVRGPQSSLFGSNAIGGVVRVITRRGGAPTASVSAEAGGYDTRRFSGTTAGSRGAFEWGAALDRLSSDGFNGHVTDAGLTVANDDYERTSGSVSAGWRSADFSIRGYVSHGTDERGAPGPFGTNPIGAYEEIDLLSRGSNQRTAASASASLTVSSRVRLEFVSGFSHLDSDFESPFGPSDANSKRWSGRAQSDVTLTPAAALSAGVELQRESTGSTFITGERFQPIPIRRWITGYFAEGRWTPDDRLIAQAGVRLENIRRDTIEESPAEFLPRPVLPGENIVSVNPKGAIAWFARQAPGSFTKLRASAGTGIRPPSGFDLAFTDNAGLKPERSRSVEGGIDQSFAGGRAHLAATAFFNEFDDLIVAVGSFQESSRYSTDNISNARSRGVELSLSTHHQFGQSRPAHVQARIGYTYLDTEILAVDSDDAAPPPFSVGQSLLRQPTHNVAIEGLVTAGRFSAFVAGGGRTRVLDVEPSTGTFGGLFFAPGFNVWNAGGAWRAGYVEIFGRVENLLDREYEEALGFPALGRRATIGLRIATSR
jgi:outer membrane cobalamin receptor